MANGVCGKFEVVKQVGKAVHTLHGLGTEYTELEIIMTEEAIVPGVTPQLKVDLKAARLPSNVAAATALIEEFLKRFLARHPGGESSVACYASDLAQWVGYLAESESPASEMAAHRHLCLDDRRIVNAEKEQVDGFVRALQDRRHEGNTIGRKLATLGSLYRELKRQGLVRSGPVSRKRYSLGQPSDFNLRSEEELFALVSGGDEDFSSRRIKALLRLIIETCAKPSDVLSMHGQDVYLALDEPTKPCEVGIGKKRHKRNFEIQGDGISDMRDYLTAREHRLTLAGKDPDSAPLLINENNVRISERHLRRDLEFQLRLATLPLDITFNDVRMTAFGLLLKQHGFTKKLCERYGISQTAAEKAARRLNVPVPKKPARGRRKAKPTPG